MPPGCHNMVYASVSHRLTQLFPFNPATGIACNNETVGGNYYWQITDPKPELILRGWSPGTTHDHEIVIRVNVLPKRVASMIPVIELLTRLLSRMGVFR